MYVHIELLLLLYILFSLLNWKSLFIGVNSICRRGEDGYQLNGNCLAMNLSSSSLSMSGCQQEVHDSLTIELFRLMRCDDCAVIQLLSLELYFTHQSYFAKWNSKPFVMKVELNSSFGGYANNLVFAAMSNQPAMDSSPPWMNDKWIDFCLFNSDVRDARTLTFLLYFGLSFPFFAFTNGKYKLVEIDLERKRMEK